MGWSIDTVLDICNLSEVSFIANCVYYAFLHVLPICSQEWLELPPDKDYTVSFGLMFTHGLVFLWEESETKFIAGVHTFQPWTLEELPKVNYYGYPKASKVLVGEN